MQILNATTPLTPAPRAPKSAMATGQIAKVTVQTVRAADGDIAPNAQGKAASAIARGADPASLFEVQVTSPDTAEPAVTAPKDALTAFQFNAPAISTQPLEPAVNLLNKTGE